MWNKNCLISYDVVQLFTINVCLLVDKSVCFICTYMYLLIEVRLTYVQYLVVLWMFHMMIFEIHIYTTSMKHVRKCSFYVHCVISGLFMLILLGYILKFTVRGSFGFCDMFVTFTCWTQSASYIRQTIDTFSKCIYYMYWILVENLRHTCLPISICNVVWFPWFLVGNEHHTMLYLIIFSCEIVLALFN